MYFLVKKFNVKAMHKAGNRVIPSLQVFAGFRPSDDPALKGRFVPSFSGFYGYESELTTDSAAFSSQCVVALVYTSAQVASARAVHYNQELQLLAGEDVILLVISEDDLRELNQQDEQYWEEQRKLFKAGARTD